MSPAAERIASRSLWLETCGDDLTPRPPLEADTTVDVAIIGGGYTGLWTALALLEGDPSRRVLVIEAEVCGFGASGRNGGWCSALFPTSLPVLAARHGRRAAVAQWRAMIDTVTAVRDDCERLGIDAHIAHGGTITAATNPAHVARLRAEVDTFRYFGFAERHLRWLDAGEASARLGAVGTLGALHTPHCLALHPARLVRGLARAVEAAGGRIVEGTRVTGYEPGSATVTSSAARSARVRARVIVRATEGYTAGLPGHRRELAPLHSLMIATEPLTDAQWDTIGLADRATFSDGRHLLIYGQRTADGRLAFGGRGAPYHRGSAVGDHLDRDPVVAEALHQTLLTLFPVLEGTRITHHWGGPLGVPRDWEPGVWFDRSTGLATAGGYVGDGVSTAHLAGHTLADLILDRDTPRRRLPWVGHRSRRWEPEPLRSIGINLGQRLAAGADRTEERRGRPDRWRGAILRRLSAG